MKCSDCRKYVLGPHTQLVRLWVNVRGIAGTTIIKAQRGHAEFRSCICKEAEMAHRVALKKNNDFVVGAIALDDDGEYYFIYSVCLESMDPEEFELPLHVIARTADKLENDYAASDDN